MPLSFSRPIRSWVGKGKPMMVTEVGSVKQGGNKARWITDAFAAMKAKMPGFTVILWFNQHGSGDWRIDTSTASAAAFQGCGDRLVTPSQSTRVCRTSEVGATQG